MGASPTRSFDPRAVGRLECRAWETYHTYAADPRDVRQAAVLRAQAMELSDRWVGRGCDPGDPLLTEERSLLVRSYAALLAAVHR
jgi:hypothetical protein